MWILFKIKWFLAKANFGAFFDFERILQIFMLIAGTVHVMDNIMDNVMDNAMLWTYYGHTVGYYRILWTCYGWFDCYCD